jgi:hypothetical protein
MCEIAAWAGDSIAADLAEKIREAAVECEEEGR